jgi:hypothetical protein
LPTPRLSDELCTEAVAIRARFPTVTEAAQAAGVNRSTFENRLRRAAERGLDGSVPKPLPLGRRVRGVSTLYVGGEERATWVKTSAEPSAEDVADTLREAFTDFDGRAEPVARPPAAAADILTLIPCADWHVGMYAWHGETGSNWDLGIAERTIGDSVAELIARAPSSGTAVVLGGGDLLHADNQENKTARSGNALDVDGRYPKVLMAASRLMVRTIDAALARNDQVLVRILKGNHDEHAAIAVSYFLLAWYRNEPRVTVDVDASLFWWHRHGDVLLGATHGHTVKLKDIPALMAARRPVDWGATRFRYAHGFHIHHREKPANEIGGVECETHQAPIPQDAWHFGAGFLSGRSLQAISYHHKLGEIGRVRVAILDA